MQVIANFLFLLLLLEVNNPLYSSSPVLSRTCFSLSDSQIDAMMVMSVLFVLIMLVCGRSAKVGFEVALTLSFVQ
jgi:hypothetical protein